MVILYLKYLSLSLYNKDGTYKKNFYTYCVIYNFYEAKEEYKNSEEQSFLAEIVICVHKWYLSRGRVVEPKNIPSQYA